MTETISTVYTDGYGLPAGGAGNIELAGATSTDYIDIAHVNAPLRLNLSGIQWADTSQNQKCIIVGYEEIWGTFEYVHSQYLITPHASDGITISGEPENVTVVLDESWISYCSYLRISGSGLGENAKITMSYPAG